MTSRHNDAWDSPGFLLWHATLRWQRAMVDALSPFDLTHTQFVLLASTWWLTENGGPPRQRDLADHAAHAGRAWRLRPTPEGAALARRALVAVESADAAYFEPVASKDRRAFKAGLRELGGRRD